MSMGVNFPPIFLNVQTVASYKQTQLVVSGWDLQLK